MVATPARSTVESPGAARAALAAGDAPRALEIYRNLAQKTGPVAENAAYEIGKILNERGQSSAAVAAWRRYRSDYPNGILRVEADVSIIETLARAGETDDALTEATDSCAGGPTASGAARSRVSRAISTGPAATAGTLSAPTRSRCRHRARATSPRPPASTARPAWSATAATAVSMRCAATSAPILTAASGARQRS